MSALDSQVGGDHYKKLGQFQPWSVLAKWMTPEELRGFMKGTVIVYLAREGDKGGDQDIEKALHTMQLYLEVSAPQAKPDETPLPEGVVFKPGPVERHPEGLDYVKATIDDLNASQAKALQEQLKAYLRDTTHE